jgi:hypothetical protein
MEHQEVLRRLRMVFDGKAVSKEKADNLYWLYRAACDAPEQIQLVFLLEANQVYASLMGELETARDNREDV